MRSAVAHLSTKNLLHNLTVIKKAAPNSKIIAMIKANAYGHGLRSVATRLQSQVEFFGVASIDEALQLRAIGINTKIILMEGVFEAEEIAISSKQNFSIVLHNKLQLEWFNYYFCNNLLDSKIDLWLKIDTGMGRLGFNVKEGLEFYKILAINPKIMHPIGVMSHFACADDLTNPLNIQQIVNFNNFFNDSIFKNLKYGCLKSFCNSAAIFNFKDQQYDVVRPGLALYGVSPLLNRTATELDLKAVMTLKTKIISIKSLPEGSSVGYGATFTCRKLTKVAVIAIGYGDGYPRKFFNTNVVIINNKRCKIIGIGSMDMVTVDVTDCPDPQIGDLVTLWGDGLPIEEVALSTENSVYNLLTAVQHRVKFFWE